MKLTQAQQLGLTEILETFKLDFLVIFGSSVTGLTHAGSDYDIGYYSQARFDFDRQYQLQQSLQKLFNDREVEVVTMNGAPPLLKKKALLEGQLDAYITELTKSLSL